MSPETFPLVWKSSPIYYFSITLVLNITLSCFPETWGTGGHLHRRFARCGNAKNLGQR